MAHTDNAAPSQTNETAQYVRPRQVEEFAMQEVHGEVPAEVAFAHGASEPPGAAEDLQERLGLSATRLDSRTARTASRSTRQLVVPRRCRTFVGLTRTGRQATTRVKRQTSQASGRKRERPPPVHVLGRGRVTVG